ncbi:malectin domain-containing carbohydrate-binding protein, partial [Daejeonella sp.]|uniref:malectin domain-containing carbohydrate-binding protein n=1 Tax=Daejeonella sp. TaxID=2805397 RepID=UPI0030C2EA8E
MKKFTFFNSGFSLKSFILLLLFFKSVSSFSAIYYFSTSAGDDNNGSNTSTTPWQTLGKLNSLNLMPGDQVLFKRGDTFVGTISATHAGSSGNPIIYGAYGSGNKPIFTGLVSLSSWTETSSGSHKWVASCNSGSRLNLVTLGGVTTPMGRYPNSGYLTVDSHSDRLHITSSGLPSSTHDWTNAELAIRINDYDFDMNRIASHYGTTIFFYSDNVNTPVNGNGFFIQNDPNTLDSTGEWYYDTVGHTLTVYSVATPSNVKAATSENFIKCEYSPNYLSFDNLAITGYDGDAMRGRLVQNWTITNCDFSQIGIDAISFDQTVRMTVEHNTITNISNTGIKNIYSSYTKIRFNTITDCGLIPQLGQSNNQQRDGILCYGDVSIASDSIIIDTNIVRRVGYCGITFAGKYAQVRGNIVDSAGLTLTDGGGIYTNGENLVGRVVSGNIITNSIGNSLSTSTHNYGGEPGIYMDDLTGYVDIVDNTISNASRFGIFLHNAHQINIRRNSIYKTQGAGIGLVHDNAGPTQPIQDLHVTYNSIYALSGERLLYNQTRYTGQINSFGVIDSNYYGRPEAGNIIYLVVTPDGMTTTSEADYTLASWQSAYSTQGYDAHSTMQVIPNDSVRLVTNPTTSATSVSLGANYYTLAGTYYPNSITLQPIRGAILHYASASGTPTSYRINAGGGAITTSLGNFTADASFSPSPGNTASTGNAIAGTTDDALYQTERFSSSGEMTYKLPIANGQYKVVLHFAETFWGATGQRKFDIKIENVLVKDNYDIYAKVGSNTATFETFNTTVADDTLTIYFDARTGSGGANEAKVCGIEVIPVVYRINSGGGQVSNDLGVFSADTLYSPSPGNTSTTGSSISNTTNDNIYQSERWGSSGHVYYNLPVANGDYTVVLHFSESFWGGSNQRKFDVLMEGATV